MGMKGDEREGSRFDRTEVNPTRRHACQVDRHRTCRARRAWRWREATAQATRFPGQVRRGTSQGVPWMQERVRNAHLREMQRRRTGAHPTRWCGCAEQSGNRKMQDVQRTRNRDLSSLLRNGRKRTHAHPMTPANAHASDEANGVSKGIRNETKPR